MSNDGPVWGSTTKARNLSKPTSAHADLEPPYYLDGDALDFWREHAAALAAADHLSPQDVPNFVILCQLWALSLSLAVSGPARDYLAAVQRFNIVSKSFSMSPVERRRNSIQFGDALDRHSDKEDF